MLHLCDQLSSVRVLARHFSHNLVKSEYRGSNRVSRDEHEGEKEAVTPIYQTSRSSAAFACGWRSLPRTRRIRWTGSLFTKKTGRRPATSVVRWMPSCISNYLFRPIV